MEEPVTCNVTSIRDQLAQATVTDTCWVTKALSGQRPVCVLQQLSPYHPLGPLQKGFCPGKACSNEQG